METIAANSGVLPLDQPLELLSPNLTPYQYSRIPKFDRGQIVHPDRDQEEPLKKYVDDVMEGRVRVNAPHVFWRRDFNFFTDRLLLKILDAKPMMDWFDRHYAVDIVYLVRHPVPQALSCARNGWGTTTLAYLHNEWFVEEVLRDHLLRDYAMDIEANGTVLERFVVNWVVENLYPLRHLSQRHQWLSLSYEETVLDRAATIQRLCQRLDLVDAAAMNRSSKRASRSSAMSTKSGRSAVRHGELDVQVGGWLDVVSTEDQYRASAILDRFGISLYSGTNPHPDWSDYRS